MNKDVLDRIECYLQKIAEDLHAIREAQAAELKLILSMLPAKILFGEQKQGDGKKR